MFLAVSGSSMWRQSFSAAFFCCFPSEKLILSQLNVDKCDVISFSSDEAAGRKMCRREKRSCIQLHFCFTKEMRAAYLSDHHMLHAAREISWPTMGFLPTPRSCVTHTNFKLLKHTAMCVKWCWYMWTLVCVTVTLFRCTSAVLAPSLFTPPTEWLYSSALRNVKFGL